SSTPSTATRLATAWISSCQVAAVTGEVDTLTDGAPWCAEAAWVRWPSHALTPNRHASRTATTTAVRSGNFFSDRIICGIPVGCQGAGWERLQPDRRRPALR